MTNIKSFNTPKYQVSRQDNTINVSSHPNGRRNGVATFVAVNLAEDTIEIRGRKEREDFNWNINLSADGATVMAPPNGRRGGVQIHPTLSRVSLPEGVQLQGESLQKFGLEVAGALVGVPLGLLA